MAKHSLMTTPQYATFDDETGELMLTYFIASSDPMAPPTGTVTVTLAGAARDELEA